MRFIIGLILTDNNIDISEWSIVKNDRARYRGARRSDRTETKGGKFRPHYEPGINCEDWIYKRKPGNVWHHIQDEMAHL